MKEFSLKGQKRISGNKQTVKTIRREGCVPCNLYGNGIENVLFSVSAKDLKGLTNTPNSYIVILDIDGDVRKAVLREVQYHPVTDEALHVDFFAVDDAKPVTINVPVVVTGHSEGVKLGGKLLISTRKLKVSALVADLPDTLEVDSTPLGIGKQIVAGDLHYEGVTIVSPKTTIICSVRPTRASAQGEAGEAEK